MKPLRILAAALVLLGLVFIGLFVFNGGGDGKLSWSDPVVRKSIMTFAYKVYGNPSAEAGRFFLSKIVFHNDGSGPVRNLSVSYQIPDYISWTTPQIYKEIPAGQTVVDLYYPQFPQKITQLTNQTNVTLETKIQWFDGGDMKEEILRSPVIFRGVNQVEYTDLPQDELLTWQDMWSTAYFTTAMVTPNDPVLKEFVAEVTKRTGGTMAGIAGGAREIARVMNAVYDYMCETGMRYTSDAGVPTKIGDIRTTIQEVRLPRDVIISNEGLCIELALLWASTMEHLGVPSSIVFIPGHAFTLVQYGEGVTDSIPIECTAITPMAVNSKQPVPFDQAVEMASKELKEAFQDGRIMVAPVREYQNQGLTPPELPAIDIQKIKNILADRSNHTAGSYAQTAGTGAHGAGSAQVRQGYFRWVGANNMIALDVPESWTRMENSPVPGMIFTAQDMQTTVAVNAFYYPQFASANDAMQTAKQGVARVSGGKVKVASQQQKGNMTIYTGTTSYRNGSTMWVGMFEPTPGGVIGLFVGAAKQNWDRAQPIIQDIIASARIGGGGRDTRTANDTTD